MRSIRILAAAIALVTTVSASAGAADLMAEAKAIRALDAEWVGVVASKDPEATAAFYAEDGVIMPPGAPALEGREAVAGAWANLFALPDFALVFWPTRLVVADSADVAWEIGAYRLSFTGDGGPVTDEGKYVVAWKKVDGRWLVGADIFNSNGPAP
jgi:uncharacterized protein (TIGR02246 family)